MLRSASAHGLHDVTLFGGTWIALDRDGHIHEFRRKKVCWVRLIRQGDRHNERRVVAAPAPEKAA